jgi:CheY-like chemotaxis protein
MPSRNEPLRVLIAEDDFFVCEMIKALVEELGHEVVAEAVTGTEALRLTHRVKPALIIMDINMPEMDGIEACHRIQAEVPCPIVILTAHETSSLIARATDAGVGAYLIKPPNVGELERAIAVAVGRFRDLQELRRLNAALLAGNAERDALIKELQGALQRVKMLSGMLPICSSCKKIRNDRGYWQQVEEFIARYSDARFSHGICPDCAKSLYPELEEEPRI